MIEKGLLLLAVWAVVALSACGDDQQTTPVQPANSRPAKDHASGGNQNAARDHGKRDDSKRDEGGDGASRQDGNGFPGETPEEGQPGESFFKSDGKPSGPKPFKEFRGGNGSKPSKRTCRIAPFLPPCHPPTDF